MKKVMLVLLVFVMSAPLAFAQKKNMDYYIEQAVSDGILFGDETGDLGTEKSATRAEFLALVTRMLGLTGGESDFIDVKKNDWFYKSISAAKFGGIFAGFDDGTARPMQKITVQDAVAILGRYSNLTEHLGTYVGVADYAGEYYAYACENGFFENFDILPTPKRDITKGEIVNLLYNYKEAYDKKDCFYSDYPKISDDSAFGMISVDCRLNCRCEIYYALCESGTQSNKWTKYIDNALPNRVTTLRISADASKKYDLYIKAVSKETGTKQIKDIKNVMVFSYLLGDGTEKSPYVIYSELQLKQISSLPKAHYILGNDITLSGEWKPIPEFCGAFDGNGYKISGLKITGDGKTVGLFAEINGGRVFDLSVDADIKANRCAGAVAGVNNGIIESCSVTGNLEAKINEAGGICGKNKGDIKNCLSAMYVIKTGTFAGGIAGQNNGRIENCLSAAESVFSEMYAGGISGVNSGGKIENCVAANIAVYNTMTYNGGKIATNQNEGITKNNYSYNEMTSNATICEEDSYSQNGFEVSWDEIKSADFYSEIGWNKNDWKVANAGFRLICPKRASEPILEYGKTVYMPKKISNESELRSIANNLGGHYILSKNISITIPWKSIGGVNGFSGTLDGAGYSISGLTLKGENGFFTNIVGGSVQNITFKNVKAAVSGTSGIVSACNFGYIENCNVFGEMTISGNSSVGGVVSENNGRIKNCTVNLNIISKSDNSAIGGVCANNFAVVEKCSFQGEITANGSNSVLGGICGMDSAGYISESYASIKAESLKGDNYLGGICAVSEGTQLYKCASDGNSNISGENIYLGGIAALSTESAIYNCFSGLNSNASGRKIYMGGICGFLKESNLQNTYSYGTLIGISTDEGTLGGICGYSENSFVMQNVTLNPALNGSGKVHLVVGESIESELSDNYSLQNTISNSNLVLSAENGIVKGLSLYKSLTFFTKPIFEGGLLGWDETAWERKMGFDYPVLTNTPGMSNLVTPKYK